MSVLEDFAKALGCREDTLFAMLRYVGDRSASAHYTVVAGWLAPVNLWEQMEIDWRLVLAKYDVPHFHMKEFAHSVGSFAKWRGQEGTRQNFLAELVDVISWRSLYGIACVVGQQDFEAVNREYELLEYFKHPYVICAAQAMGLARRRKGADFPNHDIEYILERGDPHQGRLVAICIEWGDHTPVYKRPRSGPDDGPDIDPPLIALQSADFAAWELNKAANMLGPNHPLWMYRKSLQALGKRHVEWNHYSGKDLIEWCESTRLKEKVRRRAPSL